MTADTGHANTHKHSREEPANPGRHARRKQIMGTQPLNSIKGWLCWCDTAVVPAMQGLLQPVFWVCVLGHTLD